MYIAKIPSYLKERYPIYLKNKLESVLKMKNLLCSKDFDDLYKQAHKLKGTAKFYGFPIVASLSEDLERAALNKNIEVCSYLITEVENVYNNHKPEFFDLPL